MNGGWLLVSLLLLQTTSTLSGKNSLANVSLRSRNLCLGNGMFWFRLLGFFGGCWFFFFTVNQSCIPTTEVHKNMVSLAASGTVAFGSVAFRGGVVGSSGSRAQ